MTIPARIFQTWKTKHRIPANFKEWSASFERENPTYSYELWDDRDNRRFISQEFPWFLNVYDGYPAEIYRADAVRYFYLYKFGGIYADMDTECLRPLDDILVLGDVVLGRMGTNRAFGHSIPNAIMASCPKQEFWLLVMCLLLGFAECWKGRRPEYLTGPVLLKIAVDMYSSPHSTSCLDLISALKSFIRMDQSSDRSSVTVLDSQYWYPIDWSNPIHQSLRHEILNGRAMDRQTKETLFPRAWMVTYWAHTWE